MLIANEKKESHKICSITKQISWKEIWPILIVFTVLIGLTIEGIEYVLTATANVPMMDYWRYIVQFVDKIYHEGVTLVDLWIPQEGAAHRAIGMPIFYFLANVKFFGLNTQIEIVLGIVALLINSFFLFFVYLKRMKWESSIAKCGFVLIALCMFNINQWEILTLEFSLGFMSRIFLILIGFYLFDTLQKKQGSKLLVAISMLYMFMVACLAGSYAPGALGAIVFVVLAQIFLETSDRWKLCAQNLMVVIGFIIGIVFFFNDLGGGTGDGAGARLIDMVSDGSIFRAIFYMLGSSVLHVSSAQVTQDFSVYFDIGIVMFILYMIAIFIFFKRKIYKMTYMPIMLMAYTACIILIISFGRIPMYGVNYVTSSRYVCETTLGLAGICWIFLYELQFICKYELKGSIKKTFVSSLGVVFILINLKTSYDTEMGIAPYRRIYQESLIEIMVTNEQVTDEEASKFQYDTWYVNEGIDIMEEYDLGIFED